MKLNLSSVLQWGNTLQVFCGSLKPQCLCLVARIQLTMDNFHSASSVYSITPALWSPCQKAWCRFFSITYFQTSRTVYCIIILPRKPQAMQCGKEISIWDLSMVQWEDILEETKGQVLSRKDNIWEDSKHQTAPTSHSCQSQPSVTGSLFYQTEKAPLSMAYLLTALDWCEGQAGPTISWDSGHGWREPYGGFSWLTAGELAR